MGNNINVSTFILKSESDHQILFLNLDGKLTSPKSSLCELGGLGVIEGLLLTLKQTSSGNAE